MGVAHVGLVHCDPYGYKVKGFCAVFSIERNVSKTHLQGVRQLCYKKISNYLMSHHEADLRLKKS